MDPAASLLLIDDDLGLGRLLERFMADEGYRIEIAGSGTRGLQQALSGRFALILLDVMMSDMSGFDVLRRIRSESSAPVLMLTAKGDTRDRVRGLELGADDYLPKPFDPAELVARIRAILRRARPGRCGTLAVGDLTVDLGARTVVLDGDRLALTTVEFDLLAVLVRAAGAAVPRPDLVREVLGREFSPFDRSIDTHVYNLRRKLGLGTHQVHAQRRLSLRGGGRGREVDAWGRGSSSRSSPGSG
jgi:two-component system response regulator CpxR